MPDRPRVREQSKRTRERTHKHSNALANVHEFSDRESWFCERARRGERAILVGMGCTLVGTNAL
jgi:hypothetical protein